jgi:alpha-tubulin suppressor-like RCC1 family protein
LRRCSSVPIATTVSAWRRSRRPAWRRSIHVAQSGPVPGIGGTKREGNTMWTSLKRACTAALVALGLVACGGSGDGGNPNPAPPPPPPATTAAVTVTAVDSFGVPLPGASVSVPGTALAGTTDAAGRATLDVPFAAAVNVKVGRAGYADKFEVISVPAGTPSLGVTAMLRARAPAQTIASIEAGGSATGSDGVKVTFPADALVNAQGQPVTGSIDMFMTPVDVTGPDVGAFPGLFEGVDSGGSRVALLSHGVAELVPTQGGQRLNLAPGKTAVVEIPLYADGNADGSPVQLGDVIPFWSLNEATGVWTQEGTGEVVASTGSPTGKALRATVSHFSWWNIDVPAQRHILNLTVVGPASCIPAGSVAVLRGAVGINRPAPGTPQPPVSGMATVSVPLPVALCATGVTRQVPLPAGINITVSGSVNVGGTTYYGSVTAGGPAGGTTNATVTLTPLTNPTPTITAPGAGAAFTAGSRMPIAVEVLGPEPDRVEIFAGQTRLAQISPARPIYRVDWDTTGVTPGAVELRAVAYRGMATGSAVPVTVEIVPPPAPPAIGADVQDVTVLAGANATFGVTASGTALQYQWQISLDGGTTFQPTGNNAPTLTFNNVRGADDGQLVQVVVANFLGSVTSRRARLTVNVPPQVSVSPATASAVAGQPVTFTATATGTAPIALQWQRSNDAGATWSNVPNATAAAYTFTPALSDNGARFRAVASSAFGSATSNVAVLNVTPAPEPPVITAQPQSLTLDAGQTATFSVTATGTAPLAYQWQRASGPQGTFANIAGATAATYTIAAVGAGDNGARFRAVVTNVAGTATSTEAALTVNVFEAPLGSRIAASDEHGVAIKGDGTVVVWGRNALQQLAPLPDVILTTPTPVAGLTEVRSVAAGGSEQSSGDASSFALRRDGTVWSWGTNSFGVLGDGSGVSRRTTPQPIPGLTRVVRLVVAGRTAYALREDGTVWVWGAGSSGELGLGDTRSSQPTPVQVPGLANIVAIDAQDQLAYALRSDGALFGWGQGINLTLPYEWPAAGGRRLVPTPIPSTPIANVVGVAASESSVYVFSGTDRALQAWGSNTNGKLGVGVFTTNIPTPTAVPTPLVNGVPQTWRNVRGCSLFSVGWTETGLVYAWGQNTSTAQWLGDPALTTRTATPNRVPGLDQVAEATCSMSGGPFIAVRRNNGELWTWGSNNGGQLADGNSGNLAARYTPMMVFNLDN